MLETVNIEFGNRPSIVGPLQAVIASLNRCSASWPGLGDDLPRLVDWPRLIQRELAEAQRLAEELPAGWEISLKAALARIAAVALFGLEADERRAREALMSGRAVSEKPAKAERPPPRFKPMAEPLLIRESDASDLLVAPRKFDTVRRCASCLQTFLIGEVFGWDDRWFCCEEHKHAYLEGEREELELRKTTDKAPEKPADGAA